MTALPIVLVLVLVLVLETTQPPLDRQPFALPAPAAEHESSTSPSNAQPQTAEVAPKATPSTPTPAEPGTPSPSCS